MPTLQAGELARLAQAVLVAAGSPEAKAREVAVSLVLSNLTGVDSHGVVRLEQYVSEIRSGRIVPNAEPTVEARGAVVRVDGNWCFGQLAAAAAAREAARCAARAGVAAASVVRVQHVGTLGEYVETLANQGLVGLALCNTGPPGGRVVPFGGRRAALATNPIAYAIPTGTGAPIVAGFSAAAAAEGRLRLARQNGVPVPDGWIVDAAGRPTNDPADFYEGGALLPAGGHRGYALANLAEVLGGVLAGAGCASLGETPGNGLFLLVLEPEAWHGRPSFLAGVDQVARAIAAVPPADGVDRVRLPGDPEREAERIRRRDGIPVPEGTWRALAALAAELGAPLPQSAGM